MAKIKVTNQINNYNNPSKPSMKISSHLTHSNLVVLEVNGEEYVVDGNELKRAIDNAMNTGW